MTLLVGNCLTHLPHIPNASIQLIYLDPPFFTQKEHTLWTKDNTIEYRFDDNWLSLEDYLAFMKAVLSHCRRILQASGSLFLHCDKSASHHLRLLLDQTFGSDNFQSEIIWAYRRWSNHKKGLLNSHQTIYFYSKTANFKFNTLYTDYSPTTNVDQILQLRVKNEFGKAIYQSNPQGIPLIGPEKKGVPLAAVRIQDEDLESAKQKLVEAAKAKNCLLMVLVRTHRRTERLLKPVFNDGKLLIIDSLDLTIDNWFEHQGLSAKQPSNRS